MIQFRVPWIDDKGQVTLNRGWRVQMKQRPWAIQGGLRFIQRQCPAS